jgi:hypothetical protein
MSVVAVVYVTGVVKEIAEKMTVFALHVDRGSNGEIRNQMILRLLLTCLQ